MENNSRYIPERREETRLAIITTLEALLAESDLRAAIEAKLAGLKARSEWPRFGSFCYGELGERVLVVCCYPQSRYVSEHLRLCPPASEVWLQRLGANRRGWSSDLEADAPQAILREAWDCRGELRPDLEEWSDA